MIRILIADDHPVVRQGLRQILAEESDMLVADEAKDGFEALEKMRKKEYDVVLLDISMPGPGGLDVLREIRKRKPGFPVLMLSIHEEEHYALSALRAGARGYLTKSGAPEELVTAVRKVVNGKKYVCPALAEKLLIYADAGFEKPLHAGLSSREYEVFRLIAAGRTVTEVSRKLFLSPKTVSTYRARVLAKMGMKNNAEIMRYAVDNRLVDCDAAGDAGPVV